MKTFRFKVTKRDYIYNGVYLTPFILFYFLMFTYFPIPLKDKSGVIISLNTTQKDLILRRILL